MAFSYASPTSGPSAGGIGWFDFTGRTINPGQTITGLTGTLSDGNTVTFDMSNVNVSGVSAAFIPTLSPTWPGAQFGISGYTGISGLPNMDNALVQPAGTNQLIFSNITVKDPSNNLIPNYTVIVADSETTSPLETWTWQTNGQPWIQLAKLGSGATPVLTGLNTTTATLTGIPAAASSGYVLRTQNPTLLTLTAAANDPGGSRQAIALGFSVTTIKLEKNVAGRNDPADQFQLDITGTPSAQAITAGAASGIQPQVATLYATPGNTYTINEAMAPGSVSALTDYTQTVSAANATPAGSVPPTGNLPITFTPALGDNVTYTILNVAEEAFTKTVDKAFADIGEILTYTIEINNPNNFAINNVLVTDATPAGTTYVGNISASHTYTGTTLFGGITFTTIPANTIATISWQVQVNSAPPIPTPIPNVGNVSVPGGTSGSTNAVTTQVNTAYIGVNKIADKAFADVGDIITYTLMLMNAGNVSANNVIITDAVPAGTSFVPGSVTGATGVPPTLNIAAIAPGDTATVTFKVKVDTVPVPNPIPNSATAAYSYTVDPANPNGASRTAVSNETLTQVNTAVIATTKAADLAFAAPGDIITYTITLNNTGNTAANNVVLTDAVPTGTTFVPGSVTGAAGAPPTLTLSAPIAAGDSATVTFKVQVGNTIPTPNPVQNSAAADFTYTVDPSSPDGAAGTSASNTAGTQIIGAIISTLKTVDKAFAQPGEVLTYTLALTNSGNAVANNVVITDAVPAGTTFVAGSVTGAVGTPPSLTLTNPIPAGGGATVTFQVMVGNTIPSVNPIPNASHTAYTFTVDPQNPDGSTGESDSNTVTTQINSAMVSAVKTADPSFADVGDTVTYTIILTNTGNVAANNVVLTDAIPAGTTFVAGSLSGASGTPPTLTLTNPVAAGGTAAVSFDVLIGSNVPNPNPIENNVSAAFTYTVDPAHPNAAFGTAQGGPAATLINTAKLVISKSADKPLSYIGDVITYQINVKNTGNVSADNVVLTDLLYSGVSLVPGSLVVSVPYSGTLASGLALTGPIPAGGIVTLSFKIKVDAMPNPNPVVNKVTAAYAYTVNPQAPDAVTAVAASKPVSTIIFRHNFSQQISDLIESVGLEQAALAALAQSEGAKIQKIVAMNGVDTQELLCLNRSVSDMMDSITMLEAVLKQKLNVVDCQINGNGGCK